jgi:hypothetical protein
VHGGILLQDNTQTLQIRNIDCVFACFWSYCMIRPERVRRRAEFAVRHGNVARPLFIEHAVYFMSLVENNSVGRVNRAARARRSVWSQSRIEAKATAIKSAQANPAEEVPAACIGSDAVFDAEARRHLSFLSADWNCTDFVTARVAVPRCLKNFRTKLST